MPVELEIIRAAEFIRFGAKGQFDLAGSCNALAMIGEACRRRGIERALMDNRHARAELSANELAALVNVFREIGFTQNLRLAILHEAERYQRARLFAFISRMKGWNVRAFGDFEQAMHWLSSDQLHYHPKPAPTKQRRIPITHSTADETPVPFKHNSQPTHQHTPA